MKRILFFISILTIIFGCQKEISDLQTGYFVRFYGGALDDFGADVQIMPDGSYVVAGNTTRPEGDEDVILFQTDKFGFQISESVYFGGDGDETCTGLLVQEDGFVITGSSISGGVESFILVKFGFDGAQQWTTSWNIQGRGSEIAYINNKIVVAGYLLNSEGKKRPMICNFDLDGNKTDLFAPTDNPGDYFSSLEAIDNKVFGFGTSFINLSNTEMFIIGASTDMMTFALSGNETASRIIKSSEGGFFILGTTDPIGSGFNQIVVKKLNSNFSEDLTFNANPIGANADFRGVDIQEMSDGSLAVLGDKTLSNDTDIVLYILSPDGSIRVSKIYGKTGKQSASSLKLTPDGGLIILGSNEQTNSMITLIKTDKDGNIWE